MTRSVAWSIFGFMKLNVCVCRDGFLLSAECMVVPKRATDVYWPVTTIIGVVDSDDLPAELAARIAEDVEAVQFAFVNTAEALRANLPTLAAKHPFDPAAQLHPPRE